MKKFLADAVMDWNVDVNRNTFDISKKHFASYNFGKIYPMYLRHVQPNETVKIRPHMQMEMEPLNHELYNDIKCNTAYFYVRTRSLWSSWRKFMRQDPTKSSALVHPTVAKDGWLYPGSLGNHMGIPVNSYGVYEGNTQTSFTNNPDAIGSVARGYDRVLVDARLNDSFATLDAYQTWVRRDFSNLLVQPNGTPCFAPVLWPASNESSLLSPITLSTSLSNNSTPIVPLSYQLSQGLESSVHTHAVVVGAGINQLVDDDFHLILPHIAYYNSSLEDNKILPFNGDLQVLVFYGSSIENSQYLGSSSLPYSASTSRGSYTIESARSITVNTFLGNSSSVVTFQTEEFNLYFSEDFTKSIQDLQQRTSNVYFVICPKSITISNFDSQTSSTSSSGPTFSVHGMTAGTVVSRGGVTVVCSGFYGFPRYSSQSEVNSVAYSPFEGSTPDLPLNVLPFRAYRNIYNSHFRDKILDPLRDGNGNIMVDQYVENMGDGPDSITKTDFEFCRFEPDIFNTCLPSPTMGDDVSRPLVGITTGTDPDTYSLNYHSDGKAYSIDVNTHTEGSQTIVDGIASTHSEDANNLTYLTLKDAIKYGISLQDLENVRALTKWYQASYAGKGRFEYDKFVEAHFGKQPALKENLAAEYLGGDTTFVNSFKVINQSADGSVPLGQMAGLANFENHEDAISCYCDEDGYIMGVVWFTCDNVNTQSIDKMWYLSQPGDYATPEFSDLGTAVVTMKEFLPLQIPIADKDKPFGYQRIYGDKIMSFDTVAGDFLTDKSSYLMQRRYDGATTLTADLKKMKPEDFTNVFAFDNGLDKIYGKWYFDVTISTWLQQTPNAQII